MSVGRFECGNMKQRFPRFAGPTVGMFVRRSVPRYPRHHHTITVDVTLLVLDPVLRSLEIVSNFQKSFTRFYDSRAMGLLLDWILPLDSDGEK